MLSVQFVKVSFLNDICLEEHTTHLSGDMDIPIMHSLE